MQDRKVLSLDEAGIMAEARALAGHFARVVKKRQA